MEWTGLNEIRKKYLAFFETKGHLILPSFPLVPRDDKSLLLINAGMAPMKKYFTGELTPPAKRVATCQKCVRTPDIDRVGITARHGTYFEMLGNFSFGDYFKREAIAWAWEFCLNVMKAPVERLYVSVYLEDDEAYDIWTKEIGVAPDHMARLGKEDNFWEHGAGPCGPCSEIYFDRGEKYGCGSPDCGVGCDCDRFVEFWNLVFTQFENDGKGNYTRLKSCNIDTGMGLERLACIMQGVDGLFEIDTIRNIMKRVVELTGVNYLENEESDVSLRIITDHMRSVVFMIGDGVAPSNEGRGYVLRRLLRRAARRGRLLGAEGAFLYKICETVISENAEAYPNLPEKRELITGIVKSEEESFNRTLDAGLNLLETVLQKTSSGVLSGADAFKLQDTFGFPIDLTAEILRDRGMSVDFDEYKRLYEESRAAARAARKDAETRAWEGEKASLRDISATKFTGYTDYSGEGIIRAIVADGERTDFVRRGEEAAIILDETPFYGESGGQVGDTGTIKSDGAVFKVGAAKKTPEGIILHSGEITEGEGLAVGDKVKAEIDVKKREAAARNHTAAHLLQAALRETLGSHVEQAGSFVAPDVVRFDFTHFSALTPDELKKVENRVNEIVFSAVPVTSDEMRIDEAKKLGATALFGEKYGEIVRVVRAGDYSAEFCGGTHVKNSGMIGTFKIISESSVAAGVRRIEARTGFGTLAYIDEEGEIIKDAAAALRTSGTRELAKKAAALTAELKAKDKEIERLRAEVSGFKIKALESKAVDLGGIKLIAAVMDDADPAELRAASDKIKESPGSIAIICGFNAEKTGANFICACGSEAVARGARAGDIVRAVAKLAGGSGGGRPDSAAAGTRDVSGVAAAMAAAAGIVKNMLK